jgi:hypothetical protein
MIILDLHLFGLAIFPVEANAPLFVDTNAVLTCMVTVQRFQSVAWR